MWKLLLFLLTLFFSPLQNQQEIQEPSKQLPLTAQSLDPKGIYILDDGFNFIIWLGRMLSSDLVNNILGVEFACFPDLSRVSFLPWALIVLFNWSRQIYFGMN